MARWPTRQLSLSQYPVEPHLLSTVEWRVGSLCARFAVDRSDLEAIQRLRFRVFNRELGEGLESSGGFGLDCDVFDDVSHHLMVRDEQRAAVVGTYRVQTSGMAGRHLGLVSSTLFDLRWTPRDLLEDGVELGRGCVDSRYRGSRVLPLLFRGLAAYVEAQGVRYIFGAASVPAAKHECGCGIVRTVIHEGFFDHDVDVRAYPEGRCDRHACARDAEHVPVPPILEIYRGLGVRVCGEPSFDPDFRVIDFFVALDLEAADMARFRRLLGKLGT